MTKLTITLFLIITWMPVNGFLQVIPYVGFLPVIAVTIITQRAKFSRTDLLLFLIFILGGFLNGLLRPFTSWINPALGVLTYSSLLLFTIRFRFSQTAAITFITITAILSILEGTLGILQLVFQHGGLRFHASLAAGDAVVGTLGGNSHLFAMKMMFQGLLLFYVWQYIRYLVDSPVQKPLIIVGMVLAFLSGLLASALISTIIFLMAWGFMAIRWRYVAWKVLSLRMPKIWLALGFSGAAFVVFFLGTQSGNVSLISKNFQRLVQDGPYANEIAFQKIIVFNESIQDVLLADLDNALLGIGLGRYSSRAAMILSGGYLRNHPRVIPISRSPETTQYIYNRWNPTTWARYGGSIMGMPTNSIQSMLIEFGLIGTAAWGWYFWTIIRRGRMKRRWVVNGLQHALLKALTPAILCLVAISVTDLWLEYVQLTTFIYLLVAIALSGGIHPSQTLNHVSYPSRS